MQLPGSYSYVLEEYKNKIKSRDVDVPPTSLKKKKKLQNITVQSIMWMEQGKRSHSAIVKIKFG